MSKRYSCGTIIPSECVPYTGKKIKFLTDEQQPDCDSNINDIFDLIAIAIDQLKKATDVSTINKRCLEVPTGADLKTLTQIQIDKLCGLEAALNGLLQEHAINELGDQTVTIDLQCLATAAAPCQVGSSTYTLISILNLFRSEICAIKTFLGI